MGIHMQQALSKMHSSCKVECHNIFEIELLLLQFFYNRQLDIQSSKTIQAPTFGSILGRTNSDWSIQQLTENLPSAMGNYNTYLIKERKIQHQKNTKIEP